jgi:hypothetical protein
LIYIYILGQPLAAVQHLLAAKYLVELMGGPSHPELVSIYLRLVNVYDQLGDYLYVNAYKYMYISIYISDWLMCMISWVIIYMYIHISIYIYIYIYIRLVNEYDQLGDYLYPYQLYVYFLNSCIFGWFAFTYGKNFFLTHIL